LDNLVHGMEPNVARLKLLRDGFNKDAMDQFFYGFQRYVANANTTLLDNLGTDLGSRDATDDLYFINSSLNLSYELAIVGLYKKIEIETNRALKVVFPEDYAPKNFKKVKEKLAAADISGLNFAAVDELRWINNCIKHRGTVNEDLAQFEGWEKGTAVTGLDIAYARLSQPIHDYFTQLMNALIELYKKNATK